MLKFRSKKLESFLFTILPKNQPKKYKQTVKNNKLSLIVLFEFLLPSQLSPEGSVFLLVVAEQLRGRKV